MNNLFFEDTRRGIEPPTGRIFGALKKTALIQVQSTNDPPLLYTIIPEHMFNKGGACCLGHKYAVGSNVPVPGKEEIERRAERDARKEKGLYCENNIIIYAKVNND